MGQKLKLVKNAADRKVPALVNGVKAIPFKGVSRYLPKGVKAANPNRSCKDYPA